ncbi:hypothetical protein T439DRAFT_378975 [Meredithblackwellia eburnea MCA 4105]
MAPPKRYFDKQSSSPDKQQRRGGPSPGRGAAGGDRKWGAKDRNDASADKKEKFKPKTGFISAGLKQYTDAAEAAAEQKKQQIAEGWQDKSTTQTTLHLTNLPSNLTSPQLSTLFSSYAPVRSAFVVSTGGAGANAAPVGTSSANMIPTGAGRDRTGKSTSRGFGYVRFVLRTDAESCLKEWGAEGGGIPESAITELKSAEGMAGVEWDKIYGKGGVKMAWAKKKLKEGEAPEGGARKAKEPKPAKVERAVEQSSQSQGYDPNASRTIIIQGIPLPLTEEEKAAKRKLAKAAKDESAEEMDVDGEENDGAGDDDVQDKEDGAVEPKDSGAEADGKDIDWKKALRQKAKKTVGEVEDVQWPVVLPSGESVAFVIMHSPRQAHDFMSKVHDHVLRGVLVSAASKSSWDLVQRLGKGKGGGRLMVRNLGFDVTINDLRAVFAKFGPVHSITLPLNPSTNQPRGFAFIYYLNKTVAETALAKVNGTRIYTGMAEERVAREGGKEGKKKEVREKRKREEKEGGGGGGEKGRVVAVDWALGKDEWKKAQEGEKNDETAEDGDEVDSDEDSDEESEGDEDSDMSPVPEGESDEEDEDMSPVPEGAEHPDDDDDELEEEPKAPAPDIGTTLFVRNMSFEATEAELYDLFKAFGPLRYARIVFDPATKRSRGTAFVCFWNKADAQKAVNASESLNAGLFGETSNKKKDKGQSSMLMADPASSGAASLTLHGRVLAAVPAVSKDDADKLREDRDKKGSAKADRRNLYLMREGVIFPSWAIAQTLHPSDMNARQSSFDARKALLRSNPSLYISRTRLSVRQIPLYVTDSMMKRLANYAMKEFDKEVKLGHQKALTADELNNTIVDASGVTPPVKTERIRGVPASRVRQAKILRQTDRVDPLTGLGRSKGYGFLELGSHSDALRVLRWANANRDVGALFRGWWREQLEKLIEKEEKAPDGKKGKGKDTEERVKRLREKMAELVEEEDEAKTKAEKQNSKSNKSNAEGASRGAKCLIIEFSIENQLTTKRRAEKADRARERAKRAKDRKAEGDDEDSASEDEEEDDAPAKGSKKRKAPEEDSSIKKKVKVANEKKKELAEKEAGLAQDEGKSKLWTGAIIGKKRRQKAAGKK